MVLLGPMGCRAGSWSLPAHFEARISPPTAVLNGFCGFPPLPLTASASLASSSPQKVTGSYWYRPSTTVVPEKVTQLWSSSRERARDVAGKLVDQALARSPVPLLDWEDETWRLLQTLKPLLLSAHGRGCSGPAGSHARPHPKVRAGSLGALISSLVSSGVSPIQTSGTSSHVSVCVCRTAG